MEPARWRRRRATAMTPGTRTLELPIAWPHLRKQTLTGFTTAGPARNRPSQEDAMSENIQHVTDDSFESEVLKSEVPVLVDYWAEWCGPCKAIAPLLDDIAREYSGKIKVAKVNVDENQQTPQKYGIRGIPTLMLFKGGNIEATKVGALSKSQLAAFLDSNI